MSGKELPKSWVWAPLGDLGSWAGGGTPSKEKSEYWGGNIPWVSAKDMKSFEIADTEDHITEQAIRNSATRKVPNGTVLMVTRSGILRHTFPVAVCKIPVTLNQDLKALIPDQGLLSRYIVYSLRCFGETVLHTCSKDGTTVQSVEYEQLKAFQIPIAPTNEQRRIADELDARLTEIESATEALKRVQANLKRYRASVLKAACEGRLVPTEAELARKEGRTYETGEQLLARVLKERRAKWESDQLAKKLAAGKPPKNDEWKKKYKEPAQPDTTNLPELPEGWTWATVDQLVGLEPNSITDGPFGSNLKTEHYTDSGPRVIRLQNIGDADFRDVMAHISESHFKKLQKHAIFAGDIVIAAFGDPAPRACMVSEIGPAIVKADCIRFRPVRHVSTQFLMYALNSHDVQKRTTERVHGVGRPRINLTEVKEIVLPLPPISEQTRIAEAMEAQISEQVNSAAVVDVSIARASRLRQSILKRAFEGKLVPQDPNDEPASALLDRIRAERAAEVRLNGRQNTKSLDRWAAAAKEGQ